MYGAIHEAVELLRKCQKLNACETGDCKVTLGYNLPTNHVFHSLT